MAATALPSRIRSAPRMPRVARRNRSAPRGFRGASEAGAPKRACSALVRRLARFVGSECSATRAPMDCARSMPRLRRPSVDCRWTAGAEAWRRGLGGALVAAMSRPKLARRRSPLLRLAAGVLGGVLSSTFSCSMPVGPSSAVTPSVAMPASSFFNPDGIDIISSG